MLIQAKGLMERLLLVATAVVSAAIFASANAYAESTLKNVSFASLPGGRFEVRMDFDGAPPTPAGYEIDKPARVVFDFAGVKNALTTKKYALPFENAQSAVVLGGEDRTRLILNMTSLDRYQTRAEGNSFFIEVGSNKIADTLTSTVGLADKISSEINSVESAITNIDFQRGEKGEGKILVSLSDAAANINVEQTSGEIKLNFLNTQLPVNLRRRLDVTDFATPVSAISSSFDGKDAVVSIKPHGDYDYLAYQADKLYVVSVKLLTAQEQEEKKAKFSYVGEKLSLNFQDIPVRSVLQIIADFTELNLVASDSVTGTITLRLDNVPWDQALELVLKTKGLDKRQVGSVLMVAPANEIAEQERKQLESKKQIEELAPLHTEHIQIIYADAKKVFEIFDGKSSASGGEADKSKGILSPRGSAIVDERTNSIILTETDEKIAEFRALVKQIDIPVRQVSIESRIVRATTNFSKDLGVHWGLGVQNRDTNPGISTGLGTAAGHSDPLGTGVDLSATDPTSLFSLGIVDKASGSRMYLELSALQDSGNGEVISQPKVITQDKTEALISSGVEFPFTTITTSGGVTTISTTYKEALLTLKVTPYITTDDRIQMKVSVTKDTKGKTTDAGTAIDKTKLTTEVMVANGETAVIGGIYEEETNSQVQKVPFLGDIPFLGGLFRRTLDNSTKIELLIFLTPRILNDPLAHK